MTPASRVMLALVIALSWSCARKRATQDDCSQLFDRVVALELEEQGYRDTALLARKQHDLRATLALEQRQCVGRPLAAGALDCARTARSTEDLSHRCLR
jgi:hypothetical protein